MTGADKKALKLIADRYGYLKHGHRLLGEIAGDRMLELLLKAEPTRAQIDEMANAYDGYSQVAGNKQANAAKFCVCVERVAKITPTR